MALINCKECGSQMSDKAQSCPKCGAPNPNAPMQMPAGFTFNPCAWHSDMPAVAKCVTCERAMCKNCVDSAHFEINHKPQCNECSLQMLAENIAANKKTKGWSIVKLIFLLFFMFIGLSIFMSTNDIMNAWIYAGIGGLPSALKNFVTRTAEEKWADEAMSRVDPGEGCFQQIVAFIIKIIFAFLLAPIAAIWFVIKNSIAIAKSSRAIKADQADYDAIQLSMQEMENANSFIGQEVQTVSPVQPNIPVQQENFSQSDTPVQSVKPNQTSPKAETHTSQSVQTIQTPPPASTTNDTASPSKSNNTKLIGIIAGVVVLVGLIAGYFVWYVPYAKDRDALRTYVVANNVFLRSSKMAGVEYNVLSKVPYGAELITYTKDSEWAEVKVDGVEGFAASSYLLEWNDFNLLNGVWGSADVKEYIESSKCRLAILDYCKRNQFNTGNDGWQLYTLQKDVKPNMVLFPRLNNGYDKFTEFAFILKNNVTQERRLAIYSFEEETEKPVFLYEENAPTEGKIKNIKYIGGRNEYSVSYTGSGATNNNRTSAQTETSRTPLPPSPPKTKSEVEYVPPTPPVVAEQLAIAEDDTPTDTSVNDSKVDDNEIYNVVEEMPEFPNGGMTGLVNFISKKLKYPTICQESGVQGKVVVSFVVEKDGSTTDFRVVRSVDPYLDKEALRVLGLMPKWKPGKQKGVPVRVKFTVPINFKL